MVAKMIDPLDYAYSNAKFTLKYGRKDES